MPQITTASVRIMRSFDYCNFEVTLGTTDPVTPSDVDALRQEAARLADKAVHDYIANKQGGGSPKLLSAGSQAGESYIDYSDV